MWITYLPISLHSTCQVSKQTKQNIKTCGIHQSLYMRVHTRIQILWRDLWLCWVIIFWLDDSFMSLWLFLRAQEKCKCKGDFHFPPKTSFKRLPWHLHLSQVTGYILSCVYLPTVGGNSAVLVLPETRLGDSAQTRGGLESQWAATSPGKTNSLFETGPLCIVCCALSALPGQSPVRRQKQQ